MNHFTREIVPERKFRTHQWIDTVKLEPLFGIETNIAYGKWAHVVVDDTPIMFDTKAQALAKIKEWQAKKQN